MSQSALAFSGETAPTPFTFGTHAVRVVMRDGEPWFVASDVARALAYRDAEVAARHLRPEQKGVHPTGVPGQMLTIINESGLYRLVLRSRKPEAERFSDWVTGEVLPAIRKTGGYGKPASPALDLADAPAMAAARKVALDYFASYRKAVSEGKGWVEMDAVPAVALQGMLADALMRQRFLMSFSPETGRMNCTLLGSDEFISDWKRLARGIATGDLSPSNAALVDLAAACNRQLVQRLGNPALVLAA